MYCQTLISYYPKLLSKSESRWLPYSCFSI
nr:MAG TPA: hypothetical protein [Caudoviricetes sp.]